MHWKCECGSTLQVSILIFFFKLLNTSTMASLFSRLTNKKAKENSKDERSDQAKPNFVNRENLLESIQMLEGSYKAFDEIDTQVLKNNIKIFRETNLRTINQSDLMQLLYSIISENLVQTFYVSDKTPLYRARSKTFQYQNYEDVFTTFDDIWYPKPKYIKNLGRLNDVGQPMLYTSFDALTPIHEIRSEKDEQFALIKYKVKPGQQLKLAMIAIEDSEDLAKRIKIKFNWTNKGKENWKIINEFIKGEFTKKVVHGEEYNYRSTILITHIFDSPDCDGFVYPSIERGREYNVAIKPDSVDRKIDFEGLGYWKNMNYNKVQLNRDDFHCWQKWSKTILKNKIIYEPIGTCKIKFLGLKIDDSVTYFNSKPPLYKNSKQ